ncbi:MAG: prepilin-type N-terminal cleavage/methylation domain-containing protein [Planctomycetota bacterium]
MNNSTGFNPDKKEFCSSKTLIHLHPVRKNTNIDKDISDKLKYNTKPSNGTGLNGFTLIEVLIVTVLVAFVLLAAYKAYNQGVLVWARAQQTSRQEKAIMFIEKVSRELNNSFSFKPISFTAEEARISFSGLILKNDWDWSNKANAVDISVSDGQKELKNDSSSAPITSTPLPLLVRITYEYKSEEETISRLQEVYAYPDLDELKMNPDAFKKEEPKIILKDVEKLSFFYAMTKTTTADLLEFKNDFSIDEKVQLPYAIKIELKLKSMKAPLKRTIFIPINRSLKNEEKK